MEASDEGLIDCLYVERQSKQDILSPIDSEWPQKKTGPKNKSVNIASILFGSIFRFVLVYLDG